MSASSFKIACTALFLSLGLACGSPVEPGVGQSGPDTKRPLAPEAAQPELTTVTTLTNGMAKLAIAGAQGSQTWFHLDVPAGATNLRIALGTGTDAGNDADLYVRFGAPDTSAFDCASWAVGLTDSCTFAQPAAGGWSILVYGYTGYSDAALIATWTAPAPPPPPPPATTGASISVHLTMGLPDASTADATNTAHFLSVKPQFALSYNAARKEPNWVAWELNSAWLGDADRTTSFHTDASFPASETQAADKDYTNSGFDRGHLCASADRSDSQPDNYATFTLTNVVPQAPHVNRGPWEKLEAYERTLVAQGKELFVIAGGVHTAGERTIGSGVAVPTSVFKVVVVTDGVGASVTTATRVIAVVMPNDDAQVSQSDDWRKFRVSARSVEGMTGLNFLADVSQGVQDVVENQVDAL
ncbi:MAG: DNA/RNA non-specific endonuclease [Deltaproteobacteria bacterium]|nr:DNA/RNA non-specific endonuclease [Deltaproteobacteria bacterium]